MNEPRNVIEDVRKQIQADDIALSDARARRRVVLSAAATFPGVTGTFISGGVAMGVTNDPVIDADGGAILDRRCFPSLGPDSAEGDTPTGVLGDLHVHVGPLVRQVWPDATVHNMKRGVTVRMHAPLANGQDPYVDLVLAMPRKSAAGLWIPNMDAGRWDASDPQRHVELMNSGTRALRRTRAQVVRLAKAQNKQYWDPALSSFNIVALGLEAIVTPEPIELALHRFYDHAASSLADHLTRDPAGVSGAIKVETSRATAVSRLQQARDHLATALDNANDTDVVLAELHQVFWKYLPEPVTIASKADLIDALRTGTPRLRRTATGIAIAGAFKPQRSFGDHHGW